MNGSRVRRAVVTGLLALGVSMAGLVVRKPGQVAAAQGWGEAYNLARPGCLDTGTVTNAFMRSCSGTGREIWTWNGNGKIYNGVLNGCLDDGTGVSGSRVAIRTCTPTDHQKWYAGSGPGELINLASGL